MMTIGSLFSGIGGLELGLEWAGLGPVVWQCELDPFCRAVLEKHWPNVTRFEDVSRPRNWPPADLLCGGFPCQDVAACGLGAGLAGARSGLWWMFAAVVAQVAPSWVVVENVASGMRRWLPAVRRHLCELGYRSRAFQLSAAAVGAPHLRRRVFVVAHADRLRTRQPRRQLGMGRGRAAADVAPLDGVQGHLAHADGQGQLRQAAGGVEGRDRPVYRGDAGWGPWAAEPEVGRVAHGLPRRLDRLRGLGNAVVPQQAEAIGRVIVAMLRDGPTEIRGPETKEDDRGREPG